MLYIFYHDNIFKLNWRCKITMNKWLELFIGIVLIISAILVWGFSYQWGDFWNFGRAAWEFLKGGIIWFIIGLGLIFILLGIIDLTD